MLPTFALLPSACASLHSLLGPLLNSSFVRKQDLPSTQAH